MLFFSNRDFLRLITWPKIFILNSFFLAYLLKWGKKKTMLRKYLPVFALAVIFSCDDPIVTEKIRDDRTELKQIPDKSRSQRSPSGRTKPSVTSPFSYCSGVSPIGIADENAIIKSGTRIFDGSGIAPGDSIARGLRLKAVIETELVAGDILFIPATYGFLIPETITINKSVTIASDRGLGSSQGALIKSALPSVDNMNMFFVTANGVRLSGLRIAGKPTETKIHNGIHMLDPGASITTFEVDNCEIYEWARGVVINHRSAQNFGIPHFNIAVHNNDIHDNYRPGLGYGVNVDLAYPRIFANYFEDNRHDIVGTGIDLSGFDAFCNVSSANHDPGIANYDMHGEQGNTRPNAGTFMKIHHNDFLGEVCQGNIFIDGRPSVIALIMNNRFVVSSIFDPLDNCPSFKPFAISNRPESLELGAPAYGNVLAVNNIYDNSYLGWYVKESWTPGSMNNFMRIPSTNDLLESMYNPTLQGTVVNVDEQELDYWFGDFDGDGNTDVFRANGSSWHYLRLNSGYTSSWTQLATSGYKLGKVSLSSGTSDVYKILPTMVIAHFDADSKSDILVNGSNNLQVSYGGNPWVQTLSQDRLVDQYLFGRFYSGNSNLFKFDAFKVDPLGSFASTWSIGYDLASWSNDVNPNHYRITINSSKVGDFNGDGISDIFYTTGSQWKYSSNGTGPWVNLLSRNNPPDQMVIGAVNADSYSDVIGLYQSKWAVSLGGISSWIFLDTTNFSRTTFPYGDLD